MFKSAVVFLFMLLFVSRTVGADRREYRVDAKIQLFGVTVYTPRGVGVGSCSRTHTRDESGQAGIALTFAAGSFPEKARGYNKFGYISELVNQSGARYSGFMTVAKDESYEEASRSGNNFVPAASDLKLAAIEGSVTGERSTSRVSQFNAPSTFLWGEDVQQIISLADDALRGTALRERSVNGKTGSFLSSIADALTRQSPALENLRYAWAGKEYGLKLSRKTEKRSLNGKAPEEVVRIDGTMSGPEGQEWKFKLWYKPGPEALPLKIEYAPRSYLVLVFEPKEN